MKHAVVHIGPKVEIQDVDIPEPPSPHHIVIKVHVSGTNPKDWKVPEWKKELPPLNQGDDIAGIVHSIGSAVKEFRPGDRVAAFHEMMSPYGSYAEYAVAWEHTTFHIPDKTSFEEASTLPLAAMTAALGLFQRLTLPPPWTPKTALQSNETPILIYGGATAVGAFAIKFLKAAKIGPLIIVAGRGIDFVSTLIDKSRDVIIDYRPGDEHVVNEIRKALEPHNRKLLYAYDAVTEGSSLANIWQVLDHAEGKLTVVLPTPGADSLGIPPDSIRRTNVGSSHNDDVEDRDKFFAYTLFRWIGQGLEKGWFSGHPYQVVDGGLDGLEKALTELKAGKVSAKKWVLRIGDTEGIKL